MTVALTLAAQNMLTNSGMATGGINALTSAAATSPYLAGLLNAAAAQGKTITVASVSGGGTAGNSDGSGITVDPSWVPNGSSGEPPLVFATTMAHELAHQVLPGGNTAPPSDSPDQAATIGGNNEGVALTAEYIVGQQLGLGTSQSGYIHSDQGQPGQPPAGSLTALLNQAATQAGVDVMSLTYGGASSPAFNQIGSPAVTAAATFNLDFMHPSVAPNLLYGEYYSDWNIVASCINTANGQYINPTTVDWAHMTPVNLNYVDNGNGVCTFQGSGLPLIGGGSANIGGTVRGPNSPADILSDYTSNGDTVSSANLFEINAGGGTTNFTFSGLAGTPSFDSNGNVLATFAVGSGTATVALNPTTGAVVNDPTAVTAPLANGQTVTLLDLGGSSPFALISNDNSVSTAGAVSSNEPITRNQHLAITGAKGISLSIFDKRISEMTVTVWVSRLLGLG